MCAKNSKAGQNEALSSKAAFTHKIEAILYASKQQTLSPYQQKFVQSKNEVQPVGWNVEVKRNIMQFFPLIVS